MKLTASERSIITNYRRGRTVTLPLSSVRRMIDILEWVGWSYTDPRNSDFVQNTLIRANNAAADRKKVKDNE